MLLSQKLRQAHSKNSDFKVNIDERHIQRWEKAKSSLPAVNKFLLIIGLGFLSWLTTYTGILELITANSGQLDFHYKIAVAFAVAMLMLMIIYLLDALFSPINWGLRVVYIFGYIFLTLISVGFGFGFYWKFLEARAEAGRSAEYAVEQVQTALQSGQTRLEQLQNTLDTLTLLSARKAEQERTIGRTCPKSPPGDGPRRRLRDDDAHKFHFASQFVSGRAGLIKKDIAGLDGHVQKILSRGPATLDPNGTTRNIFLRKLGSQLNLTITRFNAFRTDPQLLQFRDSFSKRAEQTHFDNGNGGKFFCPDGQLQTALRGVVRAMDGLPHLPKPEILAVEGSEAIIEAFRRLIVSSIGVVTLQLPPTVEDLRRVQQQRTMHVSTYSESSPTENKRFLSELKNTPRAGLGERDYIPLFIALFVDLCILLVSVNRPINRLHSFLNTTSKARDARMHRVLTQFHNVHEEGRSSRLDVFHNVMFDVGAKQYIAVPMDLRLKPHDGDVSCEEQFQHHEKINQIRYLTTLMTTLEEAGLVKRCSFVSASRARRKLRNLQSPFADAPSFRVYRFSKGAWPAIVMEDILGEAQRIEEEQRLLPPPLPMDRFPLKAQPFFADPHSDILHSHAIEPLQMSHASPGHDHTLELDLKVDPHKDSDDISEHPNTPPSKDETSLLDTDRYKEDVDIGSQEVEQVSAEININSLPQSLDQASYAKFDKAKDLNPPEDTEVKAQEVLSEETLEQTPNGEMAKVVKSISLVKTLKAETYGPYLHHKPYVNLGTFVNHNVNDASRISLHSPESEKQAKFAELNSDVSKDEVTIEASIEREMSTSKNVQDFSHADIENDTAHHSLSSSLIMQDNIERASHISEQDFGAAIVNETFLNPSSCDEDRPFMPSCSEHTNQNAPVALDEDESPEIDIEKIARNFAHKSAAHNN